MTATARAGKDNFVRGRCCGCVTDSLTHMSCWPPWWAKNRVGPRVRSPPVLRFGRLFFVVRLPQLEPLTGGAAPLGGGLFACPGQFEAGWGGTQANNIKVCFMVPAGAVCFGSRLCVARNTVES